MERTHHDPAEHAAPVTADSRSGVAQPAEPEAPPVNCPTRPAARRYTLHIDFLAPDDRTAIFQAEAYALALNQLRPEVDCHTALISPPGRPTRLLPVFCGAPGPDPTDTCVDVAGHPGTHHGPGATARWPADVAIPGQRTATDRRGGHRPR